jgi:hypothetical protein
MKLTRAIHHLIGLNRNSGLTVLEYRGIQEGLETLFEAKRQVKRELKAKSQESLKKWRARAEAL